MLANALADGTGASNLASQIAFGVSDEWHVDLRKPKGGSDIGQASLSWEDGGWQPFHHRQGGPRCVILTKVPFVIRSTSSDGSSCRTANCRSPTSSPKRSLPRR